MTSHLCYTIGVKRRKDRVMTYDLVFKDGNWWMVNTETCSSKLIMALGKTSREAQEIAFVAVWNLDDDIRDIVNNDRNMETWTNPKVISIKDWGEKDHWMVAWEYADGELAKVKQFSTKEESEKWLIEFN